MTKGRAARAGLAVILLAAQGGCAASRPTAPSTPTTTDEAGIHWSTDKATPVEWGETVKASDVEGAASAPDGIGKLVVLAEKQRLGEIDLRRSTPQRIEAPPRTPVEKATPVDYASLPLVAMTHPALFAQGASFAIARVDRTPSQCPNGMMPRKVTTWLMPRYSFEPSIIRIGATVLPAANVLDGNHEDPNLDELLGHSATATWAKVAATPESASFTEFVGEYRETTRQAVADTEIAARATALVESELYAFRACIDRCEEPLGSRFRQEELFIVGPPALWVGSSDPVFQTFANDQPFSFVSAPLHPGSSATLTIVALKQAIAAFREHRTVKPPSSDGGGGDPSAPIGTSADEWTTYTLDVVWSDTDGAPEVNLFTGSGLGNSRQVTQKYPNAAFYGAPGDNGCYAISPPYRYPSYDPILVQ